jgi:predicted RNA-binding protein with PIN domain
VGHSRPADREVYENDAPASISTPGGRMNAPIPVPESLLAPLIEAAGDTLRALESDEVPAPLRHLQSFDRRGIMHGPAPKQVRKVLERDDDFRAKVVERFGARPEVQTMLDAWRGGDALETVEAADARGDLALLASTLFALRPDGFEYGLGVVHVQDARRRHGHAATTDAQEQARAREEMEEARRRSDAARMEAEAGRVRAEQELRDERRARRAREEEARAEAARASRSAEGIAAQLEQAQAATRDAQARAEREARRAHDLDEQLRTTRAELDALRASRPSLGAADVRALAQAAAQARKLASELEGLSRRAEQAKADAAKGASRGGRAAKTERAPARRTAPDLPAGMVADSAAGAEAMLRTEGVTLVVDGYNVAKRAWPDASPSEQRERLAMALTALHARTKCSSTVVFDGANSAAEAVPVLRRRGLRVLFSAAGEEADDVVVREVANLSKRVPVVVASSDAWVREHAEQEGAVVIASTTLLAVLR